MSEGGRSLHRAAVLAFDDTCRLVLERGEGATAAWLMCNPSTADAHDDDPTAGRVMGHSARFGCPRSLVGNVWPLRTPYPADLRRRLRDGSYTAAMLWANLDALAMISAQAEVRVVAFGAIARDYPEAVALALDAFAQGPLFCLGTTSDGWPLHPLARGKHAIARDAPLLPWRSPT